MISPGVTAILTTFQRPKRARRAMQSILAQTLPPDEIIVVEDAGSSNLCEWLAGLGRTEIRYVCHEQNRGLAAARNTGLRLAKYHFIAYLDDDDEWLPRRLEEQIERYSQLPEADRPMLGSLQVGGVAVDPNGCKVSLNLPINQGNLRDSIIELGPSTPSSAFLFVRSALLDADGFDERLISGIDHDIWMKLAVLGYSNEIVPRALVRTVMDYRSSMMVDTERRIAGIDQFVEKWKPTYRDWFGEKGGDAYAARYFARAISKLAAQSFARGKGREGWSTTLSILRRTRGRPSLSLWSVYRILVSYLYHRLPTVRALKKRVVGVLRVNSDKLDASDS